VVHDQCQEVYPKFAIESRLLGYRSSAIHKCVGDVYVLERRVANMGGSSKRNKKRKKEGNRNKRGSVGEEVKKTKIIIR